MQFKIDKVERIVMLGGNELSYTVAQICAKRGVTFHLFTGARLAGVTLRDGRLLLDAVKSLGFEATIVEDVNAPDSPAYKLGGPTSFAISNGSPFLLRQNFLDRFHGQVINSHGAPLPEWRGGGGFSFRILANDRRGNVCLHVVSAGIDDGDIVYQRAYRFPDMCRLPRDYEAFALASDIAGMADFLNGLLDGKAFPRLKQDEAQATYYSRLHTPSQGFIDWSWRGAEIERFICAFSHPYPGARTFLGETQAVVFDARFAPTKSETHPFMVGYVFRKLAGLLSVHVRDGVLEIATDDVKSDASASQGQRFHTPSSHLDRAMSYRPVYTPDGLKNPTS